MKQRTVQGIALLSMLTLMGGALTVGSWQVSAQTPQTPAKAVVKPAATSAPQVQKAATPAPAATVKQAPAQVQIKPLAVAQEPAADTMCAYCNMMVYGKEHQMGAFTAQVETADGKHLFFDDVGCMLNYLRTQKTPPKEAWVRDYNTKQWLPYKTAVPVSAAIATPMKYGIGLFKDEASAQAFIKTHQAQKAVKTSWDAVNAEAYKRYLKRLEKMKKQQMHKSNPSTPSTQQMPATQPATHP